MSNEIAAAKEKADRPLVHTDDLSAMKKAELLEHATAQRGQIGMLERALDAANQMIKAMQDDAVQRGDAGAKLAEAEEIACRARDDLRYAEKTRLSVSGDDAALLMMVIDEVRLPRSYGRRLETIHRRLSKMLHYLATS